MRLNPLRAGIVSGTVALAIAPNALAQVTPPSITYQVLLQGTPVPSLGVSGLIILSILMLAGALYLFRHARDRKSRFLSLLVGLLGVGLIGINNKAIDQAWANGSPLLGVFNQGSTVVSLDQGIGMYDISNPGPSPVQVTGFTGDGDLCASLQEALLRYGKVHLAAAGAVIPGNSYWRICPNGVGDCPPSPTPGCTIGSTVPAGGHCYVDLQCVQYLSNAG